VRRLLATIVAGAACLATSLGQTVDAAEPAVPSMTNLRVISSEGPWQAESAFDLGWDQEPAAPANPPVAVDYQLYDSLGSPLGPVVSRTAELRYLYRLQVPAPGTYTVEAWFEDAEGQQGERASTALRFDPAAPSAPQPLAPAGWIGGDQPAVLRIGHLEGVEPPSGIRGYAFSLDDGFGSSPCASPNRCTLAETDLAGGPDDDTVRLGPLPEGATVARVVAVSGAGVASPVAAASFHVDATRPSVALGGVPEGWADGPVQIRALASDERSGMAADGPAGPFTAIAVDGGPTRAVAGDTATALVAGSGIHRIAYFARDAAGNVADGALGAPQPPTATVRVDEDPPRVLFSAAQDPAEPERIEATVEDGLSGPSQDRGSIAVRPAGGKGPFQALPTVVSAGSLRAHWDSDSFPLGKYEFRATGYDLAGNGATGATRARGGRMVLVNPVKTPTAVAVWLGDRRRRGSATAETVPYGRAIRLSGRLQTQSGTPLAGREIVVAEQFAAGSKTTVRTTRIRTGGNGSFSTRLAKGPSRTVIASFDGTPLLTRASGGSLRIGVAAGLRLHASSAVARIGGGAVTFSGDLGGRGARFPRQGMPLELQFRYRDADWSEFRTVQTDARGRFRYAYAFSDDDSRGVRFQFRACSAAESNWPYESACSRPVSITGT
jgi:hypothetical protein